MRCFRAPVQGVLLSGWPAERPSATGSADSAWWLVSGDGGPVAIAGVGAGRPGRGIPAGYGVVTGAASAVQRQRPQAGERGGQLVRPRPGALQANDEAAGVADDAGGDMQQPVAQGLGFGHPKLALQQQHLGPAAKVTGHEDQLQPDGVAPPGVERQVAQAGGLGAADAVLNADALAMAQLQAARSGSGWSVTNTWSGARRCR